MMRDELQKSMLTSKLAYSDCRVLIADPRLRWAHDPQLWVELFVTANLAILAADIYIAHSVNHFQKDAEYIPLYFSIGAPMVLGRHDSRVALDWAPSKRRGAISVIWSDGFLCWLDWVEFSTAGEPVLSRSNAWKSLTYRRAVCRAWGLHIPDSAFCFG